MQPDGREFVAAFRRGAAVLSSQTPAEIDQAALPDLTIDAARKRARPDADIGEIPVGQGGHPHGATDEGTK
ncbi:MAG: hypothetical protein JNK47_05075 [Mesorhizobium sp.]|nr:hypothetical protein [Mesorhizobium sp.]MBL8576576.1 hypothetical protein [Mesorhizobium sp.]